MNKKEFIAYLKDNDFAALFSEMGYDNPSNRMPLPLNIVEGEDELAFDFEEIAQKSSFKIYRADVEQIPTNSLCKKIDHRLRKYGENYIAIFTMSSHHLWIIPVKTVEKRTLVSIEYEDAGKAEFLAQKMDNLSFGVDEEVTITDVTSRVQKEFAVNSEKITKDFYTGFRKQHDSFAKFISGIDVEGDRQWYVSVMLNRLMFCYFIQKKGFLDFDPHYLRHKLEWCKEHKGEDKYFTFYKGFLKALFHGGLNAPSKKRLAEFEKTYGKIPYLNGGMFDEHQIERDYKDIDIKDEAFEALFDFFDKWNWHLDTRISASGKDINPDVLGYIFEQYINDRAQMGAYYTKEDITEYIGKNCIVPYVMNKVQESLDEKEKSFIWDSLANSGDTYIYDAVKKGVDLPLPDYIEKGVDTTKPNLLERRARWNEKTDDELALPTEIWRETVERRERCKSLRKKISSHEINDINDFITYNLDIRKFAEDLIEKTPSENFVAQTFDTLQNVTVLDPTCGSGAFLFAGMNILEPLYERCIDRMEEFNTKNGTFKKELDEIKDKYRSNIQYFIYKSIILRNLYGVDIMHEATEIAKLRLFLKMVAVVEVDRRAENLGLDPLPDIDFNVRCGNTLVGFANERELERSFEGDWIEAGKKPEIDAEMASIAKIYDEFRQIQLDGGDLAAFKESKKTLQTSLKKLNKTLDKKLYATNGMGKPFDEWKRDVQPFHWLSEFYQIIHGNGGFDVIIGNPPYVARTKINYIKDEETFKCSDLYGYVIRRTIDLLQNNGMHGFIVMHNLAFSRDFLDIRKILIKNSFPIWLSFFSRIPAGLFSGNARVRNAIYIMKKECSAIQKFYTTRMHRWFDEQRAALFNNLLYSESFFVDNQIPMSENMLLLQAISNKNGLPLETLLQKNKSKYPLYFKKIGYNWLTVSDVPAPCYDTKGKDVSQDSACFYANSQESRDFLLLLLNGKFFFMKWIVLGDDFHVTNKDLLNFKFPYQKLSETEKNKITALAQEYRKELPKTVQYKKNAGMNVGTYNTSKLWYLTDLSDSIFLPYISSQSMELVTEINQLVSKSFISNKGEVDESE